MGGGGTGASLIKGWANIPESYVTQVPVITLDRILGHVLRGKRALILVDVEGSEYAMLQGALTTLQQDPKPIWMVEVVSTEHQPAGVSVNPQLISTFECFFKHGYLAFTADAKQIPIDFQWVQSAKNLKSFFPTHNFMFR